MCRASAEHSLTALHRVRSECWQATLAPSVDIGTRGVVLRGVFVRRGDSNWYSLRLMTDSDRFQKQAAFVSLVAVRRLGRFRVEPCCVIPIALDRKGFKLTAFLCGRYVFLYIATDRYGS